MKGKKLVVFGLGQRGNIYAKFTKMYPDKYELVGIIENASERIAYGRKEYPGVPIFTEYRDFLKEKIPADLVAVATQDDSHCEHASAMMRAGYDLLLEKPIANTERECFEIYEMSKKYNRKVIVCHVLRYTPFYTAVKRVIDEGKLGEIVTINCSENVGYFHQAHSFVRGPWRNKEQSSPMILAKCCHDMDIIRYLMNEKCESVASYGELYYYKKENAPVESAEYCSECKYNECIYKAQILYTGLARSFASYFTTKELTDENILIDLRHSSYDRCIFKCNNDVVDHEVTIMKFSRGKTACHTMTAFSKEIYRDIKIHGTKAELVGSPERNYLEIRYFGAGTEKINIDLSGVTTGGHMGGDFYMMDNIHKVLNGEKAPGVTYLDVSLDSHLMCFAAENSRLCGGKTIKL